MENEYLVKVKCEVTGYITVVARDQQELWDKVVKGEGYDKNDIQDMSIGDVEPLTVISAEKCEATSGD